MGWTDPATGLNLATGDFATEAWFDGVKDDLSYLYANVDSTYTPVVAQGVTTNIAKTVGEARYLHAGKLVYVWASLTITGAGTAGSIVTVTLPIAPVSGVIGSRLGLMEIYDASATHAYVGSALYLGSSTVGLRTHETANTQWGQTPAVALAASDQIGLQLVYGVVA